MNYRASFIAMLRNLLPRQWRLPPKLRPTARCRPLNAAVALAGGAIQPCRNVHREDFAAVRSMLWGVAIVLGLFIACLSLVIR